MSAPFNVVAEFTIPASHPSLPGHFPARAIVPGAVLLDEICRAVTAHTGATIDQFQLNNIKFMQPVLPNLPIRIEFSRASGSELRFQCTDRNDQVYVSGNIRHEH